MIALVDCNNFYASCERVFRPDLRNKPIVVLSNNDGCVIARSSEAKTLNIDMAQPYFKLKEQLKAQGVAVFSSNYTLYGDMSSRVVEQIEQYSNQVEVYSIDEAFAVLNYPRNLILDKAKKLRNELLNHIGIPVKIGLAETKTLAKIAAKYAKREPSGVFILNDNQIDELLKKTAINDVWGIGLGWSKYLDSSKIKTAYEFTQLPDAFVKKNMGVIGLRMLYELRGKRMLPIQTQAKIRKNIMTSRSFGQPITTYSAMREAVSTYTARCSYKLRLEGLKTSQISLFLRTYKYNKTEPQYRITKSIHLQLPTNDTIELTRLACSLLKTIYKDGFRYKKAGVLLSELTPEGLSQQNLFEQEQPKRTQLMETIDSLELKFGNGIIKCASAGIQQAWKMKSEFKSPNYTTQWNDIIKI